MTPTPMPTPGELTVDPSRVTPGMLGFLSLLFLIIAVVIIYFSMRKQLSRIDFDEGAMPAGVKPLPKYATKAERQKAADAARAGRASVAGAAGAAAPPTAPAPTGGAAGAGGAPEGAGPGSSTG